MILSQAIQNIWLVCNIKNSVYIRIDPMKNKKINIKNTTRKSKFDKLWRFLTTIFHKKILVIFIGKKGVSLVPIYKKEYFKTEIFNLDEQNNIENYKPLFEKYKQYRIIFLLDNREAALSHRTIPVLHNILKVNPVEKYIVDKLDPSEIIAYNVHNISTNNGESWEATIAKTSYTSPFSILLQYVITNSLHYNGTYFLSLEFDQIVNELLKNKQNAQYKKDLQIFACITKTSDIRICVKHKNNIIEDSFLEYPEGKSSEYVQGVIQQAISDKIINFKEYTESLKIGVLVIIFCCEKLKKLFQTTKIFDCHLKIITKNDIALCKNHEDSRFSDRSLVSLFNKNKTHIAYNNQLKAITRLELANSIIFKPFILIIIGLLATNFISKVQTINIKQETEKINEKYYRISEEYRNIKTKHPTINHIGKLAELYSFENFLKKAPPEPFAMINDIYNTKATKIHIRNIDWRILNDEEIDVENIKILIDLHIEYISDFKGYELSPSEDKSEEVINNYLNHIKTIFQGYRADLDIQKDNILVRNRSYVVPAYIRIKAI